MTALLRPLATVAVLLLLLTYLLLRGTAPDLREQERRLSIIDAIVLNQAALERDALQVRAGLLSDYDPLVDGVARLRANAQRLGIMEADWAEIPKRLEALRSAIRSAIRSQEPLLETIKTSNALVFNSLAYFAYLLRHESAAEGGLDGPLAELATEMLRFSRSVDHRSADELAQALVRLEVRADGDAAPPYKAIVTHGRLILSRMSMLDGSLATLSNSPVEPAAASLRKLLVQQYQHMDRKATIYHWLLYITAMLLLFYLCFLYLKLRRNVTTLGEYTATLETRSVGQSMVAELSTNFIDIQPAEIDRGIEEALARLGRQLGVDRAYLVIAADAEHKANGVLVWSSEGLGGTPDWPLGALGLLDLPDIAELERDGCIAIPSVESLAQGKARALLEAQGVQAWLGIALWQTGRRLGMLGLEVVSSARTWHVDSLQPLRMAGDIFAHALGRQRADLEREALTGQLAQAERMQAIGTLAGGIAHNFNNVLGAILGYSEMALAGAAPGTPVRRHIDEVRKAGTRAKFLVDQILMFGRRTEAARMPVRIAALLDETLRLLGAVLPATVTVEAAPVDRTATVMGDPAQLQQIIMNLCTNAAQAMNGIGRIELTASIAEHREECTLSHGTLPTGRYVRLAVADQGHGMDQATLKRIFEPFFTTKLAGRGTGLGLATVHGIVTDHAGTLNVTSLPGERTVFEVYLPAVEAVLPEPARPRHPVVAGAGQTILLVDDEEMLVRLGEEMLAALGYEPVGFTSPVRALETFKADPARFDLVLSDEIMPMLTGDQLAAQIAGLRPDLPMLLMTGYGGLVAAERLRAIGIREVLHKPLVASDLAAALSRQLAPLTAQSAAPTCRLQP